MRQDASQGLIDVIDGIGDVIVPREVVVDAVPGHECEHSSDLATLAITASITGSCSQ